MFSSKYTISPEEAQELAEYADLGVEITDLGPTSNEQNLDLDYDSLKEGLAKAACIGSPEDFCEFVDGMRDLLIGASFTDDEIARIVVLGYKQGIYHGYGPSATSLGGCYYMGTFVEQDYQKAAELYEIAMELEDYQGVINLGYIYEYGRTGETDYLKAYEYYSLAATLDPSVEAICKMGDIFSRGTVFGKDMAKAINLWKKSYHLAEEKEDRVGLAQPAMRIAQSMMQPDCEEWGLSLDPLLALKLFQEAEVGLRQEILHGATYYQGRLQKAIEGQQQARELLDIEVCID